MKIAVCGGDKRMLFAAKAFADDGHEVCIAGFDHLQSLCDIRIGSIGEALAFGEITVLPVRPITDGMLYAPFAECPIPIAELMRQIGEKPVFSGCTEQILSYATGRVYDYLKEEDFTRRNAVLTAEAALGILINDYERAINDTHILVTGYGRIGSVLSAYLLALGAEVTVAARNPADRERIAQAGMTAVDYPPIDWAAYDVIINTVPAKVIDARAVNALRSDVFLIDLASLPGGADDQRIRERDLSLVHALSLPGKTAPLTAGTIIKDTIMKLLSQSA